MEVSHHCTFHHLNREMFDMWATLENKRYETLGNNSVAVVLILPET
jgi:hypothetical protein